MMQNRIYDVAIVGAGPAGSVFAREIAEKCPEIKAVIIDGQTENRKKPCGGLLAPDAQKVLAEFDMTLPNSLLADPQIFTVETIDLVTKQVRYYQRHYLNMDRYKFDRWLLSLVPDTVDKITSRVEDIEREDGIFKLKTPHGIIKSRSVVGADGSGSLVRRKIFGKMPYQYVSVQEWYPDNGHEFPFYSCIFDSKTSDSCSWTIHKDGYLVFGGAFHREGCHDAFLKQKERFESFSEAKLGEVIKREACLVSSPRKFRDFLCGKNGAYLVGEAAGFISASSFEGISSAIISGRCLAQAYAESSSEKKISVLYRKKTLLLRLKLLTKTFKRIVLCTPFLRHAVMLSGIESIRIEKKGFVGKITAEP